MPNSLTLGAVSLPVDLEWIDEFTWSPVAQQTEVTLGGSLLVEESIQLAGRPITLRSGQNGSQVWGVIDRATLVALQALAAEAMDGPIQLTLPDDREFEVMFRHADLAVDSRQLYHVWPPADTDLYAITLRLFVAE